MKKGKRNLIDGSLVWTLAKQTLRNSFESPIAYVVAIFFYGFIGGIFGLNFFLNDQGSIDGIAGITPWVLWFVIPALTMGLISDEIRSGTFENLATLPIRDWEIVLGKYLGFSILVFFLIFGLLFYPIVVCFLTDYAKGIDWGASLGILGGLYLLSLFYGAMGLFSSTLAKNQVVVLIIGMIFCTFFFFIGQFYALFPGMAAPAAGFLGVSSHMETLGRGVWDLRDVFYFGSFIFLFLTFSVQRLSLRRF